MSLHAAIRAKYAPPEWVVAYEVGNATGSAQRRHADAVAMHLWPSRGHELNGFEVKHFRSDWLRELKQPDKSAPVQQYCHHWWVVAPSTNEVKVDELPPSWGLLVEKEGSLRIARQAPLLEPKAVTAGFMAAMLRAAVDKAVPESAFNAEVERKVSAFKSNMEEAHKRVNAQLVKKVQEQTDLLAQIALATGLHVGAFAHLDKKQATKVREAIRIIQAGELGALKARAAEVRDRLKFILGACDELLGLDEIGDVPKIGAAG